MEKNACNTQITLDDKTITPRNIDENISSPSISSQQPPVLSIYYKPTSYYMNSNTSLCKPQAPIKYQLINTVWDNLIQIDLRKHQYLYYEHQQH